jgi:MFS transporter, PAT family, beta-lactamase induction signal transducer AmpG
MTATPEITPAPPRSSFADALTVYLKPRVLIVLFLGFSAGLPLALSGSSLQAWMKQSNIDLGTIGLFSLVATPYAVKFLWAPIVDALDVPLLCPLLGRRRGWLILAQLLLMAAIVFLAFCDPAVSAFQVALGGLLVATAAATQDIVIDAFRVESLDEPDQPAGQGAYVVAYRVGMLVSTAGMLYLVDGLASWDFARPSAWTTAYLVMAALVLVGIATTLIATEPQKSATADKDHAIHAKEDPLIRVARAAYAAFIDFLSRDLAFLALAFVLTFKLCDAFVGAMTTPFVLDLGFSLSDYATVVKVGGFFATVVGGILGGIVARALPITTSLWIALVLQMLSNLVFIWLAYSGQNYFVLAATITVENFTGAIGTVVFVVYLAALCRNPLHTATQFALLTALAAVARIFLGSPTGYLAKATGWPIFFVISTLTAIPSLFLLAWLQQRRHFDGLIKPARIVAED